MMVEFHPFLNNDKNYIIKELAIIFTAQCLKHRANFVLNNEAQVTSSLASITLPLYQMGWKGHYNKRTWYACARFLQFSRQVHSHLIKLPQEETFSYFTDFKCLLPQHNIVDGSALQVSIINKILLEFAPCLN